MSAHPRSVYVVAYENEGRNHREAYFSKALAEDRASDFPGQTVSIKEYLPSPSPDLQGELVAALRHVVETVELHHPNEYFYCLEQARAILAKLPAETTNQKG